MSACWEFPKNWMTRDKVRKGQVHDEWDHPEVGVYTRRYEGHDLEIRKGPAFKPNAWGADKNYILSVDGVAVLRVWSPSQGKPLAIKMVDRARSGERLVPLSEIDAETPTVGNSVSEPIPYFMRDDSPSVDPLRQTQFEIETIQHQKTNDGNLYFTISGTLDITALSTLTKTVELLRESGHVSCDVVLPSRIAL